MTKNKLKELQKNETICEKDDDIWRILFYKIEDIKLLKELGIYDELLGFVKKVELVYKTFTNGNYAQINISNTPFPLIT
ncbi:hypothetical protein [Paenibacillus elgii]|uniref:hypothetical protein n=1 Tax=Paenibacillus elgii TaxID=189691 RepID=UPI000248D7BC|nr:hypothetical protein [Paenibacillus elgii]